MQPKEIVAQFVENIRAQRLDEAKDLLAEKGFRICVS